MQYANIGGKTKINFFDLEFHTTCRITHIASGTIRDNTSNNATLILTSPGASGSLGDSKAIVIDGIAQTVDNVSLSSADGTYSAGDNITFNVNFNGKSKGNVDKAVVGINHIALITPEPGAYNNCTMTLTDSSNNISQPLKIPSFVAVEGQL